MTVAIRRERRGTCESRACVASGSAHVVCGYPSSDPNKRLLGRDVVAVNDPETPAAKAGNALPTNVFRSFALFARPESPPGDSGLAHSYERPPSARWSWAFVIFERPRMLRSFASS